MIHPRTLFDCETCPAALLTVRNTVNISLEISLWSVHFNNLTMKKLKWLLFLMGAILPPNRLFFWKKNNVFLLHSLIPDEWEQRQLILSNLLIIQPRPVYSESVVEEPNMGYLQQSETHLERRRTCERMRNTPLWPLRLTEPIPNPLVRKKYSENKEKKNSETLIEQPWVDWVKDEGIEDPVGASPTRSSVLNHTRQCLCNWIFFSLRGEWT